MALYVTSNYISDPIDPARYFLGNESQDIFYSISYAPEVIVMRSPGNFQFSFFFLLISIPFAPFRIIELPAFFKFPPSRFFCMFCFCLKYTYFFFSPVLYFLTNLFLSLRYDLSNLLFFLYFTDFTFHPIYLS